MEISDVQIQVETERDVYSSSTLIGVSARTCFLCCSICWPASTMPTATLGLGISHQTRPWSCIVDSWSARASCQQFNFERSKPNFEQSKAKQATAQQSSAAHKLYCWQLVRASQLSTIQFWAKQDNVFLSKIVVESLLCNFKWTSKHPFARSAEKNVGCFLGLGT